MAEGEKVKLMFDMGSSPYSVDGGRGEIRTHGGLSSSPVFKTGAFNRSATLPFA
jgi:hypothetical protein